MSDSSTLTSLSTEAATSTRPPTPAPRKGGRRREEIAKVLFVVPAFLAIVALFGYPVIKNVTMSFQEYTLRTFFTGKAPWVGLGNYLTVVSDDVFSKALANTALFTIGSIVGQFVLGMVLALFFHKNFPLKECFGRCPAALADPLIVGSAAWRAILEQDTGSSISCWSSSGSSTTRSRGSPRPTSH